MSGSERTHQRRRRNSWTLAMATFHAMRRVRAGLKHKSTWLPKAQEELNGLLPKSLYSKRWLAARVLELSKRFGTKTGGKPVLPERWVVARLGVIRVVERVDEATGQVFKSKETAVKSRLRVVKVARAVETVLRKEWVVAQRTAGFDPSLTWDSARSSVILRHNRARRVHVPWYHLPVSQRLGNELTADRKKFSNFERAEPAEDLQAVTAKCTGCSRLFCISERAHLLRNGIAIPAGQHRQGTHGAPVYVRLFLNDRLPVGFPFGAVAPWICGRNGVAYLTTKDMTTNVGMCRECHIWARWKRSRFPTIPLLVDAVAASIRLSTERIQRRDVTTAIKSKSRRRNWYQR